MITVYCSGGTCKIVERLPSLPIRRMWADCSYEITKWIDSDSIWKRLFDKRSRSFPIGLLPIVTQAMDDYEIHYVVKHADHNVVSVDLDIDTSSFEARDYQSLAAATAVDHKVGVIRVPTGGGKTLIGGLVIDYLKVPTLFLVHTKDLLYQAVEMYSQLFGEQNVGIIGDGQISVGPITVATIQTMCRIFGVGYSHYEYEEDRWNDSETNITESTPLIRAFDQVGLVIMDECHRVAAPTAMKLLESLSNPRWRIGLSASPWRDDGTDMAIQACLGPVVYSITASDLTEMGYLVPPVIRMLPVPARSFSRKAQYQTVYSEYIVENEDRNKMIVDAARSFVHRRKPAMILVSRINHGELLQKAISEEIGVWIPFISGRDSGYTRAEVLDDMKNGKCGIFIASTIADEGLDIPALEGLILAGGGKSSVRALQRVGRTLRIHNGKTHAEIVDFEDNAKWLLRHSHARVALYETEPAWTVTDI